MKILILFLILMGSEVSGSNSTRKMLKNINKRKVTQYEIIEKVDK
jgi:hypothetical protein